MPPPNDGTPRIARPRDEPTVITLTEPLNGRAVSRLGGLLSGVLRTGTVIVDVSEVPQFDTQGTSGLLALQELVGADRLVVVGVREAAARLLGLEDLLVERVAPSVGRRGSSGPSRVMPGLLTLVPEATSTTALRSALAAALDRDILIVVVDLASCLTPSADTVDVLSGAGQRAAARGQELVFLNVPEPLASALRAQGLPPTTHLVSAR